MKHRRHLWPPALLAALALLLALASPWAWANGGQWQDRNPPNSPGPRFGHTMVTIDNDIYLFGGQVQTGPGQYEVRNDLWEFQQQNDWARVIAPDPPPARYNHGAAESDGKMYIFGGMDDQGNTLNDFQMGMEWEEIIAPDPPPDRAYHSMATLPDGKVAVLGGLTKANGTYTARQDLYIYDPAANTWTRGADAPVPIYGASTVVTPDGKLYVLSGHGIAPHSNPPVRVYDPASDSWSSITPVGAAPDAPRLLASAALSGGKAYLFGGQHEDTLQIFNDTWEFDFTTNTWTQQADMPIALVSAAAAPLDGALRRRAERRDGQRPYLRLPAARRSLAHEHAHSHSHADADSHAGSSSAGEQGGRVPCWRRGRRGAESALPHHHRERRGHLHPRRLPAGHLRSPVSDGGASGDPARRWWRRHGVHGVGRPGLAGPRRGADAVGGV